MTTDTPRVNEVLEIAVVNPQIHYGPTTHVTSVRLGNITSLARQLERELATVKAELAKLREHAEAMADGLWGVDIGNQCDAYQSYRSDFPEKP